jgi:hypothetical protein
MVPGLEECLMDGSEEDVVHVAELVGGIFNWHFISNSVYKDDKYRKVLQVQDMMILKASKEPFSTG